MDTSYEIDVNLSPDTLNMLRAGGFALYAFKAVRSSLAGAVPLVWAKTTNFLSVTKVVWQDEYQAYVSANQIIANAVIMPTAVVGILPGQTAQVTQSAGFTVTDTGGTGIGIHNQGPTYWTAGLCQTTLGQPRPVCAVPLNSQMLDEVVPVDQVLLMFAANVLGVGSVEYRAGASSLLIDLTSATQRSVGFDINSGWSWNSESWASPHGPGANLVPLLIQT